MPDENEIEILNGSAVWKKDKKGNTKVTVKEGFNDFRSMNPEKKKG